MTQDEPNSSVPTKRLSPTTVLVSAIGAFGMLTAAFALPRPPSDSGVESIPVVAPLDLSGLNPIATDGSPFVRQMVVEREDTLSRLLQRGGISDPQLLLHFQRDRSASRASRKIRPGQTIQALVSPTGDLLQIDLPADANAHLSIIRNGDLLKSRTASADFESVQAYSAGTIEHSLFAATDRAGIPDGIAVQIAEIFSGDIDFHRDIRQGDRFAVVYERFVAQGADVGSGRVLAASYASGSRELVAIRFEDSRGRAGYYAPDGQSMRRAFLRSPLEFSRITSRFTGSRFHPVLQRWRAHTGVDYGAPKGTSVRATANGVIDFAGWKGGYGKLVVIRHTGNRSTAYGHLNGFARGIARGTRVEQGQTIGFVGQTGLASGPHLHYEFRVGGKAINPLTATIPDAPPLRNEALTQFRPIAELASHQLALAERISPQEDQ